MKIPKALFPKNRVIFTICLLVMIVSMGYAQVDRDEMSDLPPVTFINYEGPHARVDTREAIRQIGVGLGNVIAQRNRDIQPTLDEMTYEELKNYSYKFEVGLTNRYFVIHSISGPEGNKLDADILGLGVDVAVDHVRNLRVIIQGYLQSAYNYSASDALLLAEFITIYNAVYRGNWDYFTDRFKTPVVSHLTRERAGLSIRYDEWPGRTLLLIPLGHPRISAIDIAAITDARVIEEMRKEDDQGVPQRQQVTELIERQTEQAEQRVQQERQQVQQEQRQVQQEQRQVTQERQQVEEARRFERIPEDQAQAMRENLDRRETELARRQRELEDKSEELDETERDLEGQRDTTERLRDEIAEDQQAALDRENERAGQDGTDEDPAAQDKTVLGVTIEKTDPIAMGRIVRVDPTTGRILRRSTLDLVHVRTVSEIGDKLIAIAGENRGPYAVRLIEINKESLTMLKQGDDDIKTGSLLWVNGNDLYAITIDLRNDHCFIGRFDTNLVLQARSTVQVHPDSAITISDGVLLTQRANGAPLTLNPTTLTEIRN